MKFFFAFCLFVIQIFSNISYTIKEPTNNTESQLNHIINSFVTDKEKVTSFNDNYIIESKSSELTIEQLYPLINLAKKYMLEGKEFYLFEYPNTEAYYNAINEYSATNLNKYKEIFTTEFINSLPTVSSENYYLFSLGNLSTSDYKTGLNRGLDSTYQISDWQIEIISETEVKLVHQAFYSIYPEAIEGDKPVYFKEHILLNQADDSIHELRTYEGRSERLETYHYTLVWEDEHWKFNNFALWY